MNPYLQDPDFTLYCGDVIDVLRELPSESVDCCVTSPPYWGLRDYGTGSWEGGDPDCDHKAPPTGGPNPERYTPGGGEMFRAGNDKLYQGECGRCGARRVDRQIGLEASPAEFVARMVEVFREVRRVLAPHGTCWVNLGDSYAGGKTGRADGDRQGVDGFTGGRKFEGEPFAQRAVPEGMKPKDLVGIPWRVALALQDDGWWLRSDIVWCLSGGTRLYARTQRGEGPAMLRDLVRLDPTTVQLWNGERWTQVLGWSETPRAETVEIELRSGERIGCTPHHRWPTSRGLLRADEIRVGDVIDTCRLPEPQSPESPTLIPDEIGWLVGLYIAEGSRSGDTIQIAGHVRETDRLARVRRIAESYGATCAVHETKGNACTINLHGKAITGVIDQYVGGRTAHDKHLRTRCWRRSDSFLRYVLDGYLHGDGHYDRRNRRWRLGFTRNDQLAGDLRTIAARLGLPIRLSRNTTGWRGQIRTESTQHHSARRDGEVAAIRRSRARRFYEVGVADDPHTFALGSGVLTHNSKPNPMPESVTDRPTKAHEYLFLLTKQPRYYFDQEAVREPHSPDGRKQTAIASNGAGVTTHINYEGRQGGERWPNSGRNIRSVWEIATQPYAEAHFATFPLELPRRAIKAGCPEWVCRTCGKPRERIVDVSPMQIDRSERTHDLGHTRSSGTVTKPREATTIGWSDCGHDNYRPGIVLDPFMGSGTTALVAREQGRHAVGIDLNPAYCDLAAKRLSQLSLLADAAESL